MKEIVCFNCDGGGWQISYSWNGLPEQEQCEACNGAKWLSVTDEEYTELADKSVLGVESK